MCNELEGGVKYVAQLCGCRWEHHSEDTEQENTGFVFFSLICDYNKPKENKDFCCCGHKTSLLNFSPQKKKKRKSTLSIHCPSKPRKDISIFSCEASVSLDCWYQNRTNLTNNTVFVLDVETSLQTIEQWWQIPGPGATFSPQTYHIWPASRCQKPVFLCELLKYIHPNIYKK